MHTLGLVTWSMALGAIAAVLVARGVDLLLRRGRAQALGVAYHGLFLLFVAVLSGVLVELWPVAEAALHTIQVVLGPLCAGLSNLWIRGWLHADRRDWLMAQVLQVAGLGLPLGGMACLALPHDAQLGGAAIVTLVGSGLIVWLTVRAWLMGDRLAPAMVAGAVLTFVTIAGLYGVAMRLPVLGTGAQALVAACAALSNGLVGFLLWQRDAQHWRSREEAQASDGRDPVTQLHTGIGLVRKLIHAQRRRRRTRRDGAVVAVLLFDIERLQPQLGAAGLHELYVVLARRIQRQVGVVNPVGRYWEHCFVGVVEAIPSPAWLRTLGLRVASSVRRPVQLRGRHGDLVEVRPEIGVGLVHLDAGPAAVEDILHDAQRMARAARTMRSRAAILDPASGEVVPVEQAQLGPRRPGPHTPPPHGVAARRTLRA